MIDRESSQLLPTKEKKGQRIGYFLDCFPTVSETFVLNEIIEVARRGFEVVIFSLGRPSGEVSHPGASEWALKTHYVDKLLPGDEKEPGIGKLTWKIMNLIQGFSISLDLPHPYKWIATHASELASEVREAGCQRLHAHFAGPACQWAFVVARMLNIPFGFTAHRYDIFDRPPDGFGLLVESADVCVTVSEYNRQYLIKNLGKVAEKFNVITCGTNTDTFCPNPSKFRISGQIITVGRLSPEKGYQYLLEAASILSSAKVEFSWLIVGEGPERTNIEQSIIQRELVGKVNLLGALSSIDVYSLMTSSEIFALASISESAGMVYMEAMATATPVVGTNVMGVSEFVLDGETGFLVPPCNPELFAKRIQYLLENEQIRLSLGFAGREHVLKNLALTGQVDRLLRLWGGTAQFHGGSVLSECEKSDK